MIFPQMFAFFKKNHQAEKVNHALCQPPRNHHGTYHDLMFSYCLYYVFTRCLDTSSPLGLQIPQEQAGTHPHYLSVNVELFSQCLL